MATRQQAARDFVKTWSNPSKGREDADRQTFWNDLLQRVYGIDNYYDYITYEKDVQVKADGKLSTRRIDGYIPSTKVMIEMKGKNVKDLSKPLVQSGGDRMTPYEQASRYATFLPVSEQPRWILVSNFNEIWIYDREKSIANPTPKIIKLKDLPTEIKSLEFIINPNQQHVINEKQLSVDAGNLVAKIYDELLNAYKQGRGVNVDDPKIQRSLNMLIVRLVFLLYADDSNLFGQDNLFQNFIARREPRDIRRDLATLFQVLDQPEDKRDPYLDDEFNAFSYVNGGMFSDENIIIPQFTDELKRLIVEDAGESFDWSGISPTIFGAVFESTLNPATRRSGGMHYTSIENIHKVIDPLFLNDLRAEFDKIQNMGNRRQRITAAKDFREKLGKLKFLDPACGSGNFLTETYLSLRKMENECLRIIVGDQGSLAVTDESTPKVKIQNFYGIEINDFAVSVARTAMWIAESQMWEQTKDITFANKDFLPLDSNDSIYEGNALRMDWNKIVKPYELNYIMGNPPFVGQSYRTKAQKQDMINLFGKGSRETKQDYVICWYKKTCEYVKSPDVSLECAFVSTNSICQGESVPTFWKDIISLGVEIQFAYRTFVWNNEAKSKAAVNCVIVGFSFHHNDNSKALYDNDKVITCKHINPYLIPSEDIWIKSRPHKPVNRSKMTTGSPATDDGQLLLTKQEASHFKKSYPILAKYIKPFIGAREFLHDHAKYSRYCFWFANAGDDIVKIAKIKEMRIRFNKVKEKRLSSSATRIQRMADKPWLFAQNRQPKTKYLVIPRHSSEKREYIPIGFESSEIIASDANIIVYNATFQDFAILESSMHMFWTRTVAGRLTSRIRYSPSIFYNFPFPKVNTKLADDLYTSGKHIIEVRKTIDDLSLSEMYDPLTMPVELRKAHEANDKVVLKAYGLKPSATESEIVQHLFKMYEQLTTKAGN